MSNALTDIRAQFVTYLVTQGIDVNAYVPERITPPTIAVRAGSPYFTVENLSADYSLNLELVLLVPTATNETETEALDLMIQDVVVAVAGCSYALMGDVAQPFIQEANNATYLATTIPVQLFLTI